MSLLLGKSYAKLARSVIKPADGVTATAYYLTYFVDSLYGYAKITGQANRLTTFYHRKGSISFKVVDALGNYIRTATYTNVSMAYSKTMAYTDSNGNVVVE